MVRNKGETNLGNRNRRSRCYIVLLALFLSACSLPKLKSGLMTGAATSAVVGATSILPGGVLVPTLAGGMTAATVSALSAGDQIKGEPISVTADTVVNKAPDNFWTLLGKLVGMGGWLLGLILLLPMILGWIIPGPLTTHRKKKKS
jgi:hypothetical protein